MLETIILESGKYYSLPIIFSVSLGLLFLITYISNSKRSSKFKLPPGPRGIPLLGSVLGMVKDPHLKLSKWAKQYGDLYTISIVHRKALVVNEVKLMKELFGTMASTGKFKTETLLLMTQGPYGILNTEGKVWLEQRQFSMKNLKQLGFGRPMEPLISNEVNKVCKWIQKESKQGGKFFHLDQSFNQATVNSLWTLVTGERFKIGDSEMGSLLKVFFDTLQYTMKTGLGFCSWLKYIAPNLSGFVAFDKACKNIHNFVEKIFIEHKATYEEGKIRNMIDFYIEHMTKVNSTAEGKSSSFYGKEGWLNSLSSIVELFVAGGQSLAMSLTWCCIYVSCCNDVQKKMQDEIDHVLGNDRDPALSDRARMPYTEAVILETFRLSSVGPFGVIHELLEDIAFHGYALPKGMILMANLYHVHHDPEIWGDPEKFRPERFLGEKGDRLKDFIVAFQAGKRQCPGEPLAKDSLFLFIAKLFQQFNMRPNPSVPVENYYKADMGLALNPTESGLIITSRLVNVH